MISAVGTQDFFRLRLGCGPDHPLSSRKEFVLRPMKKAELEVAAEMVDEAGDAVEMILANGHRRGDEQVQPAKTAGSGRAGNRVKQFFAPVTWNGF